VAVWRDVAEVWETPAASSTSLAFLYHSTSTATPLALPYCSYCCTSVGACTRYYTTCATTLLTLPYYLYYCTSVGTYTRYCVTCTTILSYLHCNALKKLDGAIAFLTYFQEVTGLNLSRCTEYLAWGFLWLSSIPPGKYPSHFLKLGHNRFLLHPFWLTVFTIIQPFDAVYSELLAGSLNKLPKTILRALPCFLYYYTIMLVLLYFLCELFNDAFSS
jgi:hypothetical protein